MGPSFVSTLAVLFAITKSQQYPSRGVYMLSIGSGLSNPKVSLLSKNGASLNKKTFLKESSDGWGTSKWILDPVGTHTYKLKSYQAQANDECLGTNGNMASISSCVTIKLNFTGTGRVSGLPGYTLMLDGSNPATYLVCPSTTTGDCHMSTTVPTVEGANGQVGVFEVRVVDIVLPGNQPVQISHYLTRKMYLKRRGNLVQISNEKVDHTQHDFLFQLNRVSTNGITGIYTIETWSGKCLYDKGAGLIEFESVNCNPIDRHRQWEFFYAGTYGQKNAKRHVYRIRNVASALWIHTNWLFDESAPCPSFSVIPTYQWTFKATNGKDRAQDCAHPSNFLKAHPPSSSIVDPTGVLTMTESATHRMAVDHSEHWKVQWDQNDFAAFVSVSVFGTAPWQKQVLLIGKVAANARDWSLSTYRTTGGTEINFRSLTSHNPFNVAFSCSAKKPDWSTDRVYRAGFIYTKANKQVTLWLDGEKLTTCTLPQNFAQTNGPIHVGGWWPGILDPGVYVSLNGRIWDVSYFMTSVPESQVASMAFRPLCWEHVASSWHQICQVTSDELCVGGATPVGSSTSEYEYNVMWMFEPLPVPYPVHGSVYRMFMSRSGLSSGNAIRDEGKVLAGPWEWTGNWDCKLEGNTSSALMNWVFEVIQVTHTNAYYRIALEGCPNSNTNCYLWSDPGCGDCKVHVVQRHHSQQDGLEWKVTYIGQDKFGNPQYTIAQRNNIGRLVGVSGTNTWGTNIYKWGAHLRRQEWSFVPANIEVSSQTFGYPVYGYAVPEFVGTVAVENWGNFEQKAILTRSVSVERTSGFEVTEGFSVGASIEVASEFEGGVPGLAVTKTTVTIGTSFDYSKEKTSYSETTKSQTVDTQFEVTTGPKSRSVGLIRITRSTVRIPFTIEYRTRSTNVKIKQHGWIVKENALRADLIVLPSESLAGQTFGNGVGGANRIGPVPSGPPARGDTIVVKNEQNALSIVGVTLAVVALVGVLCVVGFLFVDKRVGRSESVPRTPRVRSPRITTGQSVTIHELVDDESVEMEEHGQGMGL